MNKRIIIVAFLAALIIVLSMSLLSKNNTLKATDEFYDYTIEDEVICEEGVEEWVADPSGEFGYTEEVIELQEIPEETPNEVPKNVHIYYQFYEEPYYGMEVYILSDISGYNNPIYSWYYSMDNGVSWNIIDGATEPTYSFILDYDNANYMWRLNVEEYQTTEEPLLIEESIPLEEEQIIIEEPQIEEMTPVPQEDEQEEEIIIYLEDMY